MSLKENIFVVFIKTFSQKPSQNHWYKKIFYKKGFNETTKRFSVRDRMKTLRNPL